MADSTVAGYVPPLSQDIDDLELDVALQGVVRDITGIVGNLVRPRWQPEPPPTPAFDVNWVAIGVVGTDWDTQAERTFDAEAGIESVKRDEELRVLASSYGPNAMRNAKRLRDGLDITQNRATLRQLGMVVSWVGQPANVPAMIKDIWVRRVDVTILVRRRTVTGYEIRAIVDGGVSTLDNEHFITPIITRQP